ncbi:hypothetical protein [Paraburkholderia dipogonis]|uniref:hypothetical protein n=1 Tax=Paraburkholderia dipogonis TaxID=1211383 RepID=UPI00366EC892
MKITGVTITRPCFFQTHGAIADQEPPEMKMTALARAEATSSTPMRNGGAGHYCRRVK